MGLSSAPPLFDAIGGDAIAAQMLADMTAAERQTWTAAFFDLQVISHARVTISSTAGVLTVNGANGINFKVTLTQNITSVVPQNMEPGVPHSIRFVQGGSGGYTVVFGLCQ